MGRRWKRRDFADAAIFNSVLWARARPDDARIQVHEGGKHIGELAVELVKYGDRMLEGELLDQFGPGRYSVMPVFGGRFRQAVFVAVGHPAAHGIRRRLAEERAKLLERESESDRNQLFTTVLEALPNIIETLNAAKRDRTTNALELLNLTLTLQRERRDQDLAKTR